MKIFTLRVTTRRVGKLQP